MSKNFMTSLFLTFQSLQTFTKKRISTFLLRLLPKISRFKLSKKALQYYKQYGIYVVGSTFIDNLLT